MSSCFRGFFFVCVLTSIALGKMQKRKKKKFLTKFYKSPYITLKFSGFTKVGAEITALSLPCYGSIFLCMHLFSPCKFTITVYYCHERPQETCGEHETNLTCCLREILPGNILEFLKTCLHSVLGKKKGKKKIEDKPHSLTIPTPNKTTYQVCVYIHPIQYLFPNPQALFPGNSCMLTSFTLRTLQTFQYINLQYPIFL